MSKNFQVHRPNKVVLTISDLIIKFTNPYRSIRERLCIYLRYCKDMSVDDERWKWDKWQRQDALKVVDPNISELMLLRCRGGSKTRDSTAFAVFLGYQKRKPKDDEKFEELGYNRILWFSASETQLDQVRTYFKKNKFVNNRECTAKRIALYNGNEIFLGIMTNKQSVSKRADIIFYDEEQSMDQKAYWQSQGTMVGCGDKRIHIGTTEMDTVFEQTKIKLEKLASDEMEDRLKKGLPFKYINYILEHTVSELSWTSREEELKKYVGAPEWFILSQLDCKWVRAGGRVFPKVEVKALNGAEFLATHYGIDPNPKSGHAMVGLRLVNYEGHDIIYVSEEYGPNGDSEEFIQEILAKVRNKKAIELEENAGEEFYKRLEVVFAEHKLIAADCINLLRWSRASKSRRVYATYNYKIIIHPRCKNTIKHIQSAIWDPTSPAPKIQKTDDQHFLDSFLHACMQCEYSAIPTIGIGI